jgi:hypothetical protein
MFLVPWSSGSLLQHFEPGPQPGTSIGGSKPNSSECERADLRGQTIIHGIRPERVTLIGSSHGASSKLVVVEPSRR